MQFTDRILTLDIFVFVMEMIYRIYVR
jgi:hypothetical protein